MNFGETGVMYSEETDQLDAAMCEVAENTLDAIKNTEGYNYKYPQLNQIIDLVKPCLEKAGLVDFVIPTAVCEQPGCAYKVLHKESRQYMVTAIPLSGALGGKTPMQDLGGALTYMARYFRVNVWGVLVWDVDAKRNEDKKRAKTPGGRPTLGKPSKQKIIDMIESTGDIATLRKLHDDYIDGAMADNPPWDKELVGLCKVRKEELNG